MGPCGPTTVLPRDDSDNSCVCDEDFSHKIDDIILEWLHCIPVLAVCSFSDRCMKAKSINCLKSNLKILIANDDVEAARAEIFKRLSSLPLWYPYDPDIFKAELAEDLLSKLKDLKKVKKVSLAEWLRNVPLWYSDEERENFSNNLEISYGELKSKGLSKIEIQTRMKKSISGMIGKILEKQGKVMELGEKSRLVNDIFEVLFDSIGDDKKGNVVNMYEQKIAEWIQGMPMSTAKTLPPGQKTQNEKFVKTLAEKLAKLSDLPAKEKEKRMEEEIGNNLNTFLEQMDQDMTPGAKKKNVAKLMQSITADSSKIDIANTLQEEMLQALAKSGLIPSTLAEKKEFDSITRNTVKKIEELKTRGNSDEEIEELLRDNYNDAIEAILEYKGESLNSKAKKQLLETLMKQYSEAASGIDKVSESATNVEDAIRKYFDSDAIPELVGMSSADKNDLSAKMTKKIAQLTGKGFTNEDIAKKVQNELTDLLQDLGLELTPETLMNLANGVVEVGKSSANKSRQNRRKSEESLSEMEDDAIFNIQKDLVEAFENIPELASTAPQEKNEVEKICTRLAKKVTENLSDDNIKDKLKDDMTSAVDEILNAKPENTLSSKNKIKAVEQLLNQVVKSGNETRDRRKLERKLANHSFNAFEDIPELSNSTPAERKELDKISQKLAKRVDELKAEACTEEQIREKLSTEFGDVISEVLMPIDSQSKDTVFGQIMNKALKSSLKSYDPSK